MIKFQYTTAQAVYLLISIVSSVIFLQQVFVINIGGSFKIYEIIALLLCVIFICYDKPKIYGKLSVILFCLLIITPIISFIFLMLDGTKYDYYSRFPDAVNSLRTNVVFAPLILLIYYCFCWVFLIMLQRLKPSTQTKTNSLKHSLLQLPLYQYIIFTAILQYTGLDCLI